MPAIKTSLFYLCVALSFIFGVNILLAHPVSDAVNFDAIPTLPVVSVSASSTTLLAGNSATLTAAATAGTGTIVSYQWILNGTVNVGTNSSTYIAATAGSYTVKVFDSAADSAISNAIVLENTSPLNGIYTIGGVPDFATNFSSMANAAFDINTRGVSGDVTINFIGNPAENAPPGGIKFSYCSLTPSLKPNASQKVSFIGPATINAPLGISTTLTAGDGIIKLEGADWFTFDQVNIADNNATPLTQMEWGYAFLKCDGNNGSNYNTIKNCTITLKKTNFFSTGIYSGNHDAAGILSPAYTGSAAISVIDSSRNGHNVFIGNIISNVNNGIYLNGNALTAGGSSTSSLNDTLNEVGRIGLGLGNSITNFGGNANAASGVIETNQRGMKVNNNIISGGTGTTGAVSGISMTSGAWGEIRSNTISLASSSPASGITGITCSFFGGDGGNPNLIAITGNTVSSLAPWTTAATGGFTAVTSSAGGTGSNVTISNNVVENITFAGSGGFTGISCGSPANLTASSNTISGISKSGVNASGTMTCFTSGSVPSSSIIINNTISNISIILSGALTGNINGMTSAFPVVGTWTENKISNLFILGSTTANSSSVTGLQCNASTVASLITLAGNSVSGLSSVPAIEAIVNGMQLLTCINMVVKNNTVCNISAGGIAGIARGMQFTGGTIGSVYNVYNNRIGDIRAQFANPSVLNGNSVIGIDISSGSAASIFNLTNNTIALSGTGGGSFFGSSGINVNTGPLVSLCNNIIINTIVSGVSSHSAAYRRSSPILTSYAANSNNNIFYAGVPSSLQAIFFDGTSTDATLAAYQSRVSTRDNNSKTENVQFFNTTCGDVNYLKVSTAIPTLVEGGAIPVAGITADFEGDVRNSFSPDIGADEGSFINELMTVPELSANPAGNQCTAVNHSITAIVVPGVNFPVLNVILSYAFNGIPGAGSPVLMTNTGGNSWTGIIPAAIPANALVTWSVTADDASARSVSGTGLSYRDEYLLGTPITASVNPSVICLGSVTTLKSTISGPQTPPAGYCISTGSNLSDEQIFGFTFGTMNNNSQGELCTSNYTDYTGTVPAPAVVAGSSVNWSVFQSECDGATFFANGISIFIDYNRDGDFLDAGEEVFTTNALTIGPRTLTGSITIPANASLGVTRMRVICAEGFPFPNSCLLFNYGETEDYLVNITGGLGFTYLWNDGVNTIASAQNAVYTPVAAGSFLYTVTATDPNGCTLTISKPVTVAPLPATSISTNGVQCGFAVPNCYVTGGGGSYNWYLTTIGGAPLPGENNSSLTAYAIDTSTIFYVSSYDGLCESPRTMVIQQVTTPPPVSASNNTSGVICPFVDFDLIASGIAYTNFTWTASPSAGSGINGSAAGNLITSHAESGGTYVYTVVASDGICAASSTTSVIVLDPPAIVRATASPDTVCSGENITLKGLTNEIGAGTAAVGNDTLSNLSSTYPTPYGSFYTGGRLQMLVRASELTASGLRAGNITSVAFNITALNVTLPFQNFTIRMAPTALTSLTNIFVSSGFTTVYTNTNYTAIAGINTHIFNVVPFNWDGNSNVVVEVTFLNCTTCPSNPCINYTFNASTAYTETAYGSSINAFADFDCGIASQVSGTVYLKRPNMIFGGQTLNSGPGALAWQWSPGSIPSGNTAVVNPVNGTANPIVNNYTIQAIDMVSGCSNYITIPVLINPLPAMPMNYDGAQCGAGIPNCSVLGGGGSFRWYLSASGGSPLQGETLDHLVSYMITSSQYFYVSEWNGQCESNRVSVYVDVIPSDSITVLSNPSTCSNEIFNLSVSKAPGINNYVYTWTASPAAGSGIPTSVVGENINIVPDAAGTYAYTVFGYDSITYCGAVSTDTVKVVLCNTGIVLNVKMYIEGYYAASNTGYMDNYGVGGCLFLNGLSANPNDADSVEISMMDAAAYHLIEAQKGILKSDGTVKLAFGPAVIEGNAYYIRVKHRNALQTWSANPVVTSAVTAYDFSSAQSQAYGNNMVQTTDGLHWAFYSGDISNAGSATVGIQDEVIESQDYSDLENAVYITLTGYVPEDITGDVIVESMDYSIMENNVFYVVSAVHP